MVMRKYKYYTIYKITNLVNGKIYIGAHQTDDLDDGYMGSGKVIKAAITKHGRHNFIKELLFENLGDMATMYNKEAELVTKDFIKRKDTYNLVIGGFGRGGAGHYGVIGYRHTEEAKRKISDASKSRVRTMESRKKMSESMKGKNLGKRHSQKTKEKLSKMNLGRVVSEETRKRMSDAQKISATRRGSKLSEDTKAKISKALKGKTHSTETKRKMSAAQRKRFNTE